MQPTIIAIPDDVWAAGHVVIPVSQLAAADAAMTAAGTTACVLLTPIKPTGSTVRTV